MQNFSIYISDSFKKRRTRPTSKENCEDQIDGSVGPPYQSEESMAPRAIYAERLVIFRVNATVPLPKAKVRVKAEAKRRVTGKARAKVQHTRLGALPQH